LDAKKQQDGFWRDKNVLITGATGFVGGKILERLLAAGANPVALVRDFVPKSEFFEAGLYRKTRFVHGHLEDFGLLRRVISEYEAQIVFHVGAQTQVTTALEDPMGTFHANILGSCNVLEACRNSKAVEAVVVSSSDKAYGIAEKLPYTEDMPLKGAFPYEVSKSCVDLIAQSYFQTYGLPVTIARCGNTYGEGDLNFKRLVPKVIKCVAMGLPLAMRSDGSPKRDFVYIEDIVDAYMLLGRETGRKGVKGEAFNFSLGKALRVKDVVDTILRLMGSSSKPVWTNSAEKEIPEQYLSIDKARKILGWEPKFGLEAGLKRTIPWYLKLIS